MTFVRILLNIPFQPTGLANNNKIGKSISIVIHQINNSCAIPKSKYAMTSRLDNKLYNNFKATEIKNLTTSNKICVRQK